MDGDSNHGQPDQQNSDSNSGAFHSRLGDQISPSSSDNSSSNESEHQEGGQDQGFGEPQQSPESEQAPQDQPNDNQPDQPGEEHSSEEVAAAPPQEVQPDNKPESDPQGQPEATPVTGGDSSAKPHKMPVFMPAAVAPKFHTKDFNPRVIFEAVLVLLVIVLGLSLWNVSSDRSDLKKQVAQLNANPETAVQKETQQIIGAVGKLMTLPTNETPTVASVTDANAAKAQSAFFNKAQNGDKVLLYVKAGEAILYRPSTNKIIEVAPLNLNNSSTTGTSSTSTTSTTTKH